MKKSFSARRVARKIGQEDEEEDSSGSAGAPGREAPEPVVKRPPPANKAKKKSALRMSFGPGDADADGDGEPPAFTPKKSNLSRLAMEKNAERKSLRPALSSENLGFRASASEDRPSYSKDHLAELKQSTPSTPKDLGSLQTSEDEDIDKALEIQSKFGPLAKLHPDNAAIPTEAEIREKKERRARLAKEQEYMSLDADDSEEEQRELLLRPKEKYAETRLVPEDEDLAEGFDDFVEDGRISLGRKAEREEKRRKRKEMSELIAEAEGAASDEASEDSDLERNEAYEAAQTRAGTYGQKTQADGRTNRPRTPPKITPVPELGSVLEKLRGGLRAMEESKAAKVRKLDDLRAEKKEISEREVWIQAQLKETGERYEKLRIEAGLSGSGTNGVDDGKLHVDRGLESLGTTPVAALSEASDD